MAELESLSCLWNLPKPCGRGHEGFTKGEMKGNLDNELFKCSADFSLPFLKSGGRQGAPRGPSSSEYPPWLLTAESILPNE